VSWEIILTYMDKNTQTIFNQDLHIHTTYSTGDSSVTPQQTIEFVAQVRHARIIGISDHLEYLDDRVFGQYRERIHAQGLHLGAEVNGSRWVKRAIELGLEYYIYPCCDKEVDYKGVQILLESGKPVIIAHPLMLDTDLNKVPSECYIEINNRYVWRYKWRERLRPYVKMFDFVIASDAHTPNWLAQHVAHYVAEELGIKETILFKLKEER
jgi:histidinol phosphatase-like PHP family hydrolase